MPRHRSLRCLLPVRPTAENADFEFTGVEEGQGRLGRGSATAGQDQATVPGWNRDNVPHVNSDAPTYLGKAESQRLVVAWLFPESACEGFFVKKQPLYYIFTPSHLQI